MIIGIGSDILDITRIEKIFNKHPYKFPKKLLSPKELEAYSLLPHKKAINYLAKRWAAKEAFGKACGTGIRNPILFTNITITKDNLGKPKIETHRKLTRYLSQNNISNIHISLSDDPPLCLAFIILENQ